MAGTSQSMLYPLRGLNKVAEEAEDEGWAACFDLVMKLSYFF